MACVVYDTQSQDEFGLKVNKLKNNICLLLLAPTNMNSPER